MVVNSKKTTKKHSVKSTRNRNTRKIQQNKNILDTVKLMPIYKLTSGQIAQLVRITSDKKTMKNIGVGKPWRHSDILQFIKDEIKELSKKLEDREYFTYILFKNINTSASLQSCKVIGFISGRKNAKLMGENKDGKNDILLRMFIGARETGKGYGKAIIGKFLTLYKGLIGTNSTAKLISDIDSANLASIKIHNVNGFKFIRQVKYPNGKYYKRYVKNI